MGRTRRLIAFSVDAAIVAVLFEDYERHGDANVLWTAQMDRVPAIARAAAHARAQHREWLEGVFADRLPAPGPAREHALNLHYAATDVYLWKLWRRDLGLSREDAERAMCDLLTSIDPERDTMRKNFLFATWSGGGAVPPVLSIARALRERGHDVRVLADRSLHEESPPVAWNRSRGPRRPRATPPIRPRTSSRTSRPARRWARSRG
ncbi:hypothetical protein ACQP2K_21655 [Microbispora siamensis]